MKCSDTYKAVHDSGPRSMSSIKWIVIHCTQGSTARGAASWFANPAAGGSTQLVVDDNECYRTLPDDHIPWGAIGGNTNGLHLELAGFADWTRAQWLKHDKALDEAAKHVAHWCIAYDIPASYVGALGLKRGKKGICFHYTVTKAFKLDTHTDPGPNFPKDRFLSLVRKHLDNAVGNRHSPK